MGINLRGARFGALGSGVALALMLAACGEPQTQGQAQDQAGSQGAAAVDGARLAAAGAAEPGQWLSSGRTWDEQRFSPLDQITRENVGDLGLAWFADLDTNRGQEATPLYIDGVLYVSTAWSKVYAFDAKTGETLWQYDPEVPGEWGGRGCCDVVNRGVAAWNGKIYVGAYDGRLIAIDAETGEEVWTANTIDPQYADFYYTITGQPRAARGLVFIGNGGAEFSARGYVSAYDAETGDLVWRFYTVPGNPADGFENAAMEMAAGTWNGEWWLLGGGGTVWDAIVYDDVSGLLYLGVGNGTPWNAAFRSPGGGDNLFLASIVAVDPETGEYVWHYQTTPGESWDYTATQPIMVADLEIGGQERRVVMQAPKNGFFYVLDARTGELISADAFAPMTWASGVDMETGRPIENPAARFGDTGQAFILAPSAQGAHAWHPWSYSPDTGLVYLPFVDSSMVMASPPSFTPNFTGPNTGIGGPVPADIWETQPGVENLSRGPQARLIAWDPVARREVWRSEVKGGVGSGAAATAGGLVFSGSPNLDGWLAAHDAETGEELWRTDTHAGVVAAPMSYELDGEQYVAQLVGYGVPGYGNSNGSRLLVYRLGGTEILPAPPPAAPLVLDPPAQTASAETVEAGRVLFTDNCAMCHETQFGNRGLFPDLRYSARLGSQDAFDAVVLHGALEANGMIGFAGQLSEADAEALRANLVARAHQLLAAQPGQ